MGWTIARLGSAGGGSDFAIPTFSKLTRTRKSQTADEVLMAIDTEHFDEPLDFSVDDRVYIALDGIMWFSGQLLSISRYAEGSSEFAEFHIAGPWNYLREFEYQQRWRMLYQSAPVWVYSPHVLLNRVPGETEGITLATTAATLTEILQYVLDQCTEQSIAAPFQIGSILPGTALYIPLEEADHISAELAIRHILRWHPDAVTWFDYTTNPPTIHIDRESNFQAIVCKVWKDADPAIADNRSEPYAVEAVRIRPMTDSVRNNVRINFVIKGEYDGEPWQEIVVDQWPIPSTGREYGAISATINLIGERISFLKGEIKGVPFDSTVEPLDINWWKQRVPTLYDLRIKDLAIDGSPSVELMYDEDSADFIEIPNIAFPEWTKLEGTELTSGLPAPWMLSSEELLGDAKHVRVRANVSYRIEEPGGANMLHVKKMPVMYQFVLCSLEPGIYSDLAEAEEGDPVPAVSSETVVGIAKYLQQWYSTLRYEGSIRLSSKELPSINVGRVINVTGTDQSQWASMRGVIQSIVEDVPAGIMDLTFGPADHLGANDIVELLRVYRGRRRYTNPLLQSTGKLENMGQVEFPDHAANLSTDEGQGHYSYVRVQKDPAGGCPSTVLDSSGQADASIVIRKTMNNDAYGPKNVSIDTADLADSDAAKFRECEVCVNGVTKYAMVLMTAVYDTPRS